MIMGLERRQIIEVFCDECGGEMIDDENIQPMMYTIEDVVTSLEGWEWSFKLTKKGNVKKIKCPRCLEEAALSADVEPVVD